MRLFAGCFIALVSFGTLTLEGYAGEPDSLEELFDLESNKERPSMPDSTKSQDRSVSIPPNSRGPIPFTVHGFAQSELAYTWPTKSHWSKFRNLLDLHSSGQLGGGFRWNAGIRLIYDPIYDLTNFYPDNVANDQRFQPQPREIYLDYSVGDWDFRLGNQLIVWGEMVGLFFADVVSAKDLRQYVLPDFELIRLPQWAIRTEYYKNNLHSELVWIPIITYDNIGKVGSEFFPFNPLPIGGARTIVQEDKRPADDLSRSAFGARVNYISNGWDVSGFYFSTPDLSPAFARRIDVTNNVPTVSFSTRHERIHQFGLTLAKDVSREAMFKAEAIYTVDRLFSVNDPANRDGLIKQGVLDYVLGIETSWDSDTRANAQFFQRYFPSHDPSNFARELEYGFSLLLSTRALHPKIEPELLYVHSLNRGDWMFQAKLTWEFAKNWRWVNGIDVFGGTQRGLFGRFDNQDRAYTEFRLSF